MKYIVYISALVLSATQFLQAKTLESPDASIHRHYAPPVIGNGSIVTSIDYEGEQTQKNYRFFPEIVWEGRRYSRTDNKAALITMGHYKTDILIDGKPLGKLKSWKQRLNRQDACIETTANYERGTVKTLAFVPMGQDMLAVQKEVIPADKNAKSAEIKFTYLFTHHDGKSNPPRVLTEVARLGESGEAILPFTIYGLKVYRGAISLYSSDKQDFIGGNNTMSMVRKVDLSKSKALAKYVITFADNYNTDIAGDLEKLALEAIEDSKKRKSTNALRTIDYSYIEKIAAKQREDEFPIEVFQERAKAQKTLVEGKGFDGIFANHKKAWEDYYKGSFINIPDNVVAEAYLTGLYHMKTVATRWSFPVTIFGHGNGWSGRFFAWDEMFTSLSAMSCGKFDLTERVAVFRRKLLPIAIMRVSYYREPIYNRLGARYVWETCEDGSEGTNDGLWVDHIFHMSTASETCWKHYVYTGDKKYLKETGYPVMRECALYLLSHHVYENNGRITIGKCTDIERLGAARENPFLTSCGVIYSFETAAKAADILGIDKELAAKFREKAAGLRKTLPQNSEMYVPYAGCKEKSIVTICGYFPFPVIDPNDPKGKAAVYDFKKNIYTAGNMVPIGKKVCSWYSSWLSSALSEIDDGKNAFDMLKLATDEIGLFSEPWEILEYKSNPWFVSSAGNFIFAFNRLLLFQNENSELRVAWGVPESWTDYSFKLPTYGNGWLDAEIKSGKLAKLTYTCKDKSPKTLYIPTRLIDSPKSDWSKTDDGKYYKVKVNGEFSL